MARWAGYVGLLRPGNVALAALGVLAGAVGAAERDILEWSVLLAAVAAGAGVGASNALNDANDAQIDRTAHPKRPIPRGSMDVRSARRLGFALLAAAVVAAAAINPWTGMLAALLAANVLVYESWAKRHGLLGHALVAWNAGSLFLLGGLSIRSDPLDYEVAARDLDGHLVGPLAMAALALLLNLAREVYKGIEDAPHDAGRRRTLALGAGSRAAQRFAAATTWIAALAALGAAPLFAPLYLPLMAPVALLLVAVPFVGNARRSRAALKVAMLAGLVPFVVPKLI